MANLVNLDAMIARADFAQNAEQESKYDSFEKISIELLTKLSPLLRKPDFQRETNHWSPSQVVLLLECFINGDLIPSVILWRSPLHVFVIDGGHRLSVLRSWVLDDYGDGPTSLTFFGSFISKNQKKAAELTRNLISEKIGSYKQFQTMLERGEPDPRVTSVFTRALPVQWVPGDSDRAEASFFKINTQGTPLDYIEQSLLEHRRKPIAISARGIIRAGMGHKYWSRFDPTVTQKIEEMCKDLHLTLFEPELSSPVKTLDLPLGGSKGVRTALQVVIEYLAIVTNSQNEKTGKVDFKEEDNDGNSTTELLRKAQKLTNRITGNDHGSLGLHPAIYYYGPTGVHSSPFFLGTAKFINKKITNNDPNFFTQFSLSRTKIENALISYKELIATVLQKLGSIRRVNAYSKILENIYEYAKSNKAIDETDIIDWGGVAGKVLVGNVKVFSTTFSEETKSRIFIETTLRSAPKCPICGGYIDSNKSISYDHIVDKSVGGTGDVANAQITHPYCNQTLKDYIRRSPSGA